MVERKNIINLHNFIYLILIIVIISNFVYAQVIDTQVIDLSEKARDFFIEATKGNIVGQETVSVYGHFKSLNEVDTVDIQSQGGNLVFLQSAEILTIVSTSALDTLGGVNATSVMIFGLDENFSETNEIVNLSGTTPVNTINEYIRVNDFKVHEVGVYGASNEGLITLSDPINLQTEIESGFGMSQSTHYTVPAGKEAIITSASFTVATDKFANAFLYRRDNANDVVSPFTPEIRIREIHGINAPVQIINFANLKFPEKSDIWFRALGDTGDITIEVEYQLLQYSIGT